jgi:hypothetical protein
LPIDAIRDGVPSGTPPRRALLGFAIVVAVLLMHGMASTSGCSGGMPMPTATTGPAAMAVMTSPAEATSATGPLWTALRDGGGGEMCVSLPASQWSLGVLVLVVIAAAAGHDRPGQATPRRHALAWRGPPVTGAALLTRIGISRT